jgi:antitoxin component YwqK of YwqJK toxin-antitoxin module
MNSEHWDKEVNMSSEIETKREYWDQEEKKIKSETLLQDGQRHGVSRHWHENGQLKGVLPYQNGRMYGMRKEWHENGQLESEVPYRNGQIHGIVKYRHEGRFLQDVHVDGRFIGTFEEALNKYDKLWFLLMFGIKV